VKGNATMKNRLKLTIEEHAFNEEEMLRHILSSAQAEGILPIKKAGPLFSRAVKFGLVFGLVLAFALINIIQWENPNPKDPNTITAIYTLDINPSFEIKVNSTDKVISIIPKNEDAALINSENLIGKESAYVLEELIKRSEVAGFIDTQDLANDYVLVSAIPITLQDQAQINDIENKIKTQTKNSQYLQNLNIAIIISSASEFELAETKNIPVGIYLINALINQSEDDLIGCRQFFSDPQNRATFQTKGDIHVEKVNRLKARILIALSKLDRIGLDTTEIKTRLISAKDQEIITIQNEVLKLLIKYHLGSVSEINMSKNENI